MEGLLGGVEDQVVDDLLVTAGETSQTLRQSEGSHEVRDGQE